MERTLSISDRQPRLSVVFAEELRLLWRHYRLQWLGLGLVFLVLYALEILPQVGLVILVPERPWWDIVHLMYVLLALYWALVVWHDLPPGRREMFYASPAPRPARIAGRVTAGGLLLAPLVIVPFLSVWWVFTTLTFLVTPDQQHPFLTLVTPQASMIMAWVGTLNLYLAASVVAIRLRRPERWVLLYLPITLLLFFLFVVNRDGPFLLLILDDLVLGPHGLFNGFSIRMDFRDMVHPLAPLIWLPIWSGLLWLVARRERLE